MQTTLILPFPGRIVASDTQVLQALDLVIFPGMNARQLRRQFIITNVSTVGDIKVQNAKSQNLLTVFPRVALTLETSEDLQITTASTTSIEYEVTEIFFDEGTAGSPTEPGANNAGRDGYQAVAGGGNHSSFFGGTYSGAGRPSR